MVDISRNDVEGVLRLEIQLKINWHGNTTLNKDY